MDKNMAMISNLFLARSNKSAIRIFGSSTKQCRISCTFFSTVNSSFMTSKNNSLGTSFRAFVKALIRSKRFASK